MTRNRRRSVRWGVGEDVLRSAIQKYCRRGMPDRAVAVASEMVLNGIGLSVARNLILFAFEDYGPAAPHLITRLVPRVDAWMRDYAKLGCPVADMARHRGVCADLFRMVAWVADPKWARCRAWPMLGQRSMRAIECGEDAGDDLLGDAVRADAEWMSVGAPPGSPWHDPAAAPLIKRQFDALDRLDCKHVDVFKTALLHTHSRLVMIHAFACARRLVPTPLYTPPAVRDDDMNVDAMLAPSLLPLAFETWVRDKHTGAGRRTDMTFFLEHGALVTNEALVRNKRLAAWIDEGRQWYLDLERRHGTRQARSVRIRERLHCGYKERKGKRSRESAAEGATSCKRISAPVVAEDEACTRGGPMDMFRFQTQLIEEKRAQRIERLYFLKTQ